MTKEKKLFVCENEGQIFGALYWLIIMKPILILRRHSIIYKIDKNILIIV